MSGTIGNGAVALNIFHTATIDLNPGTIEALERLGLLKVGAAASQMAVNDTCAILVHAALRFTKTASRASGGVAVPSWKTDVRIRFASKEHAE